MQHQADAEVVERVKGLFEWTFQLEIPYEAMMWIVDLLRLSWHDGDPSEQELIRYLVQLHVHLSELPEDRLEQSRATVLDFFRREYTNLELNDRGRVLVMFRGLLETIRPGCTHAGVATGAATAAAAAPQTAAGGFLADALSGDAAAPAAPSAPASAPLASARPGGIGLGRAAALMPGQSAPAAPTPAQPAAAAPRAPAGQAMPGVPDMLQQQMMLQEQQQQLMMMSNQSKRMHELTMSIINNM